MAVYWITGFSGAGKTTVGKDLYKRLLSKEKFVVFLDGDELRKTFDDVDGYDKNSRKLLAFRYARLCKMLSNQGLSIVIATISMFSEVHKWNRENLENYVEIYIKVPIEILIERDQKKLYTSNQKNVVGYNSQYEEPKAPHIVLLNDNSCPPSVLTDKLVKLLKERN